MNLASDKRMGVAKISLFITSIFVIFLSISYAFINQTLTGTKRQVITSGNLELELKEGNAITLSDALPMYDEVGMIQEPFTFSVANKTDKDTDYTLKLVDITPEGTRKLDTAIVKYGLEKDDAKAIGTLSSLTKGVLDAGKISGNQTIHYTLRLWIDSEAENEEVIKEKSLSYKIAVEAKQEIKVSYNGMIKERKLEQIDWSVYDLTYNDYYQYHNNITNIVIENRIHVPDTIAEDKQWDMSVTQNKSVMAYLEEDGNLESGDVAYRLHIQGNGGVVANENSIALFYDFPKLLSITGFEYLDVSNVKSFQASSGPDRYSIFENCPKLKLDLSKLDTSKVTNMSSMFYNYQGETLILGDFDTSNVTDMSYMFYRYSSSQPLDLSSFDTSNVTDMSYMFYDCSSSAIDLSSFNTSNVTNMSGMFAYYSDSESLDLSTLDTSSVTNMSYMFASYRSSLPLDLSNFNTSSVTNMTSMFSNYSSNQPLDLSNFNTSNVTNMTSMFSYYRSSQPLDLSNFNTSKVTNMQSMFSEYSGGDLMMGDWEATSLTNFSNIFNGYRNGALTIRSWNIQRLTNLSRIFYNYKGGALTIENLNAPSVTDMSSMFREYSGGSLTIKNWNTPNLSSTVSMFSDYSGGTMTIEEWDTSSVTNMSNMFNGYSSSQPLNLSSLNASRVTRVVDMFSNYKGGALTIENLDAPNLTSMDSMFNVYSGVTLTIKNWNTPNLLSTSGMFAYYSGGTLTIEKWDTSSVTDMSAMFQNYKSSQPLDLSNLDISNVTETSMAYAFSNFSDTGISILVKDEAMKNKILKGNPNLTNVTIKGA